MSSGGFTAAYKTLAPRFESETGVKLVTAYGASSGGAPDSIPERLKRGERADVVILSQNGLNAITRQGFVEPDSHTPLANSMIGMAVRAGAAAPDISTKLAFIETLLAAKSIGYSASASGTYLSTQLFPALGIWDRIKAKSVRIESERVATVVARGDVQIGFQQISEILPIEGVTYVGPIPQDVQKVTLFSAGLTHQGDDTLAWILVCYLSAPEHGGIIEATGLTPAPSTDRRSSRCGR
ncbi:MAG: substrate-binding domain-containing protein [Sphingomonadales bacterium]|nr:substrate-binding domain-containing protein [Sphingomonadales bacterium]